MILGRFLLTALLAVSPVSAAAAGASAAAADYCLTRAEQRARAAAHAVVPLSRAMRAVHKRGEVIHARLCEHNGHLVYLLTVLGHDGKVAQASVDAASGTLVGAHPHDKPAKDKLAKDKDAKAKETNAKETKDKDVKDNDAKDRDAKDRDAKDRDAKDKDAKDKDAKDKDAKDKDAKDKDAKDRDAKDRDAKKTPK
jgi:uncharacterized membrane protein YkoI